MYSPGQLDNLPIDRLRDDLQHGDRAILWLCDVTNAQYVSIDGSELFSDLIRFRHFEISTSSKYVSDCLEQIFELVPTAEEVARCQD